MKISKVVSNIKVNNVVVNNNYINYLEVIVNAINSRIFRLLVERKKIQITNKFKFNFFLFI